MGVSFENMEVSNMNLGFFKENLGVSKKPCMGRAGQSSVNGTEVFEN